MNNENRTSYDSGEDLEQKVFAFLGQGGTFKELKNMSDDAMEAIYSVAYNFYQNGKYEEAIKVFQFLCFYDHFNRKYFLGLGACQQMQKQYDNAIEVFSFASLLGSDDPRPMIYIGDCHMAKGDKENARVAYEASIGWDCDQSEHAEDLERIRKILDNLD